MYIKIKTYRYYENTLQYKYIHMIYIFTNFKNFGCELVQNDFTGGSMMHCNDFLHVEL
jgi:hypothetical protein